MPSSPLSGENRYKIKIFPIIPTTKQDVSFSIIGANSFLFPICTLTFISSWSVKDLSIDFIDEEFKPFLPIIIYGFKECARPLKYCLCLDVSFK